MNHTGLLYRCRWSLLKRLGARRIVAQLDGYRLRVRFCDPSARLMYFGQYEPEEAAQIRAAVQPGMVVCDIGANTGYFSLLLAALAGPQGRVFAFEPNPSARALLEENLLLNPDLSGRIELSKAALSARAGVAQFFCPPEGHEGVGGLRDTQRAPVQKVVEVPTQTLDEFAAAQKLARLDFIKLDVEGGELDVLRGAAGVLSQFKPRILFEVCDDNAEKFGYRVIELLSFVESRGYRVRQAGTGYNFLATPT